MRRNFVYYFACLVVFGQLIGAQAAVSQTQNDFEQKATPEKTTNTQNTNEKTIDQTNTGTAINKQQHYYNEEEALQLKELFKQHVTRKLEEHKKIIEQEQKKKILEQQKQLTEPLKQPDVKQQVFKTNNAVTSETTSIENSKIYTSAEKIKNSASDDTSTGQNKIDKTTPLIDKERNIQQTPNDSSTRVSVEKNIKQSRTKTINNQSTSSNHYKEILRQQLEEANKNINQEALSKELLSSTDFHKKFLEKHLQTLNEKINSKSVVNNENQFSKDKSTVTNTSQRLKQIKDVKIQSTDTSQITNIPNQKQILPIEKQTSQIEKENNRQQTPYESETKVANENYPKQSRNETAITNESTHNDYYKELLKQHLKEASENINLQAISKEQLSSADFHKKFLEKHLETLNEKISSTPTVDKSNEKPAEDKLTVINKSQQNKQIKEVENQSTDTSQTTEIQNSKQTLPKQGVPVLQHNKKQKIPKITLTPITQKPSLRQTHVPDFQHNTQQKKPKISITPITQKPVTSQTPLKNDGIDHIEILKKLWDEESDYKQILKQQQLNGNTKPIDYKELFEKHIQKKLEEHKILQTTTAPAPLLDNNESTKQEKKIQDNQRRTKEEQHRAVLDQRQENKVLKSELSPEDHKKLFLTQMHKKYVGHHKIQRELENEFKSNTEVQDRTKQNMSKILNVAQDKQSTESSSNSRILNSEQLNSPVQTEDIKQSNTEDKDDDQKNILNYEKGDHDEAVSSNKNQQRKNQNDEKSHINYHISNDEQESHSHESGDQTSLPQSVDHDQSMKDKSESEPKNIELTPEYYYKEQYLEKMQKKHKDHHKIERKESKLSENDSQENKFSEHSFNVNIQQSKQTIPIVKMEGNKQLNFETIYENHEDDDYNSKEDNDEEVVFNNESTNKNAQSLNQSNKQVVTSKKDDMISSVSAHKEDKMQLITTSTKPKTEHEQNVDNKPKTTLKKNIKNTSSNPENNSNSQNLEKNNFNQSKEIKDKEIFESATKTEKTEIHSPDTDITEQQAKVKEKSEKTFTDNKNLSKSQVNAKEKETSKQIKHNSQGNQKISQDIDSQKSTSLTDDSKTSAADANYKNFSNNHKGKNPQKEQQNTNDNISNKKHESHSQESNDQTSFQAPQDKPQNKQKNSKITNAEITPQYYKDIFLAHMHKKHEEHHTILGEQHSESVSSTETQKTKYSTTERYRGGSSNNQSEQSKFKTFNYMSQSKNSSENYSDNQIKQSENVSSTDKIQIQKTKQFNPESSETNENEDKNTYNSNEDYEEIVTDNQSAENKVKSLKQAEEQVIAYENKDGTTNSADDTTDHVTYESISPGKESDKKHHDKEEIFEQEDTKQLRKDNPDTSEGLKNENPVDTSEELSKNILDNTSKKLNKDITDSSSEYINENNPGSTNDEFNKDNAYITHKGISKDNLDYSKEELRKDLLEDTNEELSNDFSDDTNEEFSKHNLDNTSKKQENPVKSEEINKNNPKNTFEDLSKDNSNNTSEELSKNNDNTVNKYQKLSKLNTDNVSKELNQDNTNEVLNKRILEKTNKNLNNDNRDSTNVELNKGNPDYSNEKFNKDNPENTNKELKKNNSVNKSEELGKHYPDNTSEELSEDGPNSTSEELRKINPDNLNVDKEDSTNNNQSKQENSKNNNELEKETTTAESFRKQMTNSKKIVSGIQRNKLRKTSSKDLKHLKSDRQQALAAEINLKTLWVPDSDGDGKCFCSCDSPTKPFFVSVDPRKLPDHITMI